MLIAAAGSIPVDFNCAIGYDGHTAFAGLTMNLLHGEFDLLYNGKRRAYWHMGGEL